MQEQLAETDIERLILLFDSIWAPPTDADTNEGEIEGQIEARYLQWLSESDYYNDIPW